MRTSSDLAVRDLSISTSAYSSQQLQVIALESGLSSQASNGNFLAAMTAASGAFSLGRALGTSLFSNVLGGAGLRGAAFALGFTGEVLTFRGVNQILTPGSESWLSASGIASTATDFLMMKGAGVFCGTSSYGVRQFVQASAMVGGEYVGESIGVREQSGQAFSERFAHALATGVAMEAGGLLMRRATAGRIEALQRNLEQQASARVQATERRDAQVQSSPQMAANSPSADPLPDLIREALNDGSAVERLLNHVHNEASLSNLQPMIEAARSFPQVAKALVDSALRYARHFEAAHITSLIEVGKTQPLVRKALATLAGERADAFTAENVTDILAYEGHENLVEDIVNSLGRWRGWGFFTRDHVPGVIALAKTPRSVGWLVRDGSLANLIRGNTKLFRAEDLPVIAEIMAINSNIWEPLRLLIMRTFRTSEISWDAFMRVLHIEEARHATSPRHATTKCEESVLFEFDQRDFVFFTPERIKVIIEAAKTQWVAAGILQSLVGVNSGPGRLNIDLIDMHAGLSSEHVPGIIEAAVAQEPAARALNGLVYPRQRRKLVRGEDYPAILEAVTRNPGLGTVVETLVESLPHSFTRDHLPPLLDAAEVSESVAKATRRLIYQRADLAAEIPLPRVIGIAKNQSGMADLLCDIARDRPGYFAADHLPGMIEAAQAFRTASEALELVLNASPRWMTPEHLARMVSAAETQVQPNFTVDNLLNTHHSLIGVLVRFVGRHSVVFTNAHIRTLLEREGNTTPTVGVLLSRLAGSRPGLFTARDYSDMIALAHAQERLVEPLEFLSNASNERVYVTKDKISSLIRLARIQGNAAFLLEDIVKQFPGYFDRDHLPDFIEVARSQRGGAVALNALVQARPELFTPTSFREVVAVLAHWVAQPHR